MRFRATGFTLRPGSRFAKWNRNCPKTDILYPKMQKLCDNAPQLTDNAWHSRKNPSTIRKQEVAYEQYGASHRVGFRARRVRSMRPPRHLLITASASAEGVAARKTARRNCISPIRTVFSSSFGTQSTAAVPAHSARFVQADSLRVESQGRTPNYDCENSGCVPISGNL